jgi:F0F1-type ATP synthase delta subunit
MKYKTKIYAKALAESLANEKADDKKITANFLRLLQKNGDMKKADEILALAEALLLKKSGNKKVILETARKTDLKDFTKAFVKKGDAVQEKINPSIVAGVKIMVDGNRQLDLSLLNKLNNIF